MSRKFKFKNILLGILLFLLMLTNIALAADNETYYFDVISSTGLDEKRFYETSNSNSVMDIFFKAFIVDTCAERITLYANEKEIWQHIAMPSQFNAAMAQLIETKKVINGDYGKCANLIDWSKYLDGQEVIFTDNIPQLQEPITEEDKKLKFRPYIPYYNEWTEYKDLHKFAEYNGGENVYKLVEALGEKENDAYIDSKGEVVDFETWVKEGATKIKTSTDKEIDAIVGDYLAGDKNPETKDYTIEFSDEDARYKLIMKFEPMALQPYPEAQEAFFGQNAKIFWSILCNDRKISDTYKFSYNNLKVLKDFDIDITTKYIFIAPTSTTDQYGTSDMMSTFTTREIMSYALLEGFKDRWKFMTWNESFENAKEIPTEVTSNTEAVSGAMLAEEYSNLVQDLKEYGLNNLPKIQLMLYVDECLVKENGNTYEIVEPFNKYLEYWKEKHTALNLTVQSIQHDHNKWYTFAENESDSIETNVERLQYLYSKNIMKTSEWGTGLLMIENGKIATSSIIATNSEIATQSQILIKFHSNLEQIGGEGNIDEQYNLLVKIGDIITVPKTYPDDIAGDAVDADGNKYSYVSYTTIAGKEGEKGGGKRFKVGKKTTITKDLINYALDKQEKLNKKNQKDLIKMFYDDYGTDTLYKVQDAEGTRIKVEFEGETYYLDSLYENEWLDLYDKYMEDKNKEITSQYTDEEGNTYTVVVIYVDWIFKDGDEISSDMTLYEDELSYVYDYNSIDPTGETRKLQAKINNGGNQHPWHMCSHKICRSSSIGDFIVSVIHSFTGQDKSNCVLDEQQTSIGDGEYKATAKEQETPIFLKTGQELNHTFVGYRDKVRDNRTAYKNSTKNTSFANTALPKYGISYDYIPSQTDWLGSKEWDDKLSFPYDIGVY